jgi:hypothetical protein
MRPASCYLLAISSFGPGQESPSTLHSSEISGLGLPLCRPHALCLPGLASCSFGRLLQRCCWLSPAFPAVGPGDGLALPLLRGCLRYTTPLGSIQPSPACRSYLFETWCPALPSCRSWHCPRAAPGCRGYQCLAASGSLHKFGGAASLPSL